MQPRFLVGERRPSLVSGLLAPRLACPCVGLSYDTKFNLSNTPELPYNEDYFSIPPHAPHGQILKLGTLHPRMGRIALATF